MKLASYGRFGVERAGILDGERIVDLEGAMFAAGLTAPVSKMRSFLELEGWEKLLEDIWGHRESAPSVDASKVRIGAPILPRKLVIIGANTHSHFEEAAQFLGTVKPRVPLVYGKVTSSICGPNDEIVHPRKIQDLDYEVELGVIIGKQARRISESQVQDYVAGFCVINDASARDIRLTEKQTDVGYRVHLMGKSFDTFCPMGPCLVTKDEFKWGQAFRLKTSVNGVLRQCGDTGDLIFGVEQLVSYISQGMTLFPGDVIATGSPAGAGFFMNPPGFVRPGDVVRCEIDGLGALENRIVAEVMR